MNALENNNSKFRYQQLQDFDAEIDWRQLIKIIAHHYFESGIGKLQVPVESMIRVYFLQLRYNLNAAEASRALSKIDVLRLFALIDKSLDVIPEEESIHKFRSLIELNGLAEQFVAAFNIQPFFKDTECNQSLD